MFVSVSRRAMTWSFTNLLRDLPAVLAARRMAFHL
jgi:hypothetical protein